MVVVSEVVAQPARKPVKKTTMQQRIKPVSIPPFIYFLSCEKKPAPMIKAKVKSKKAKVDR
jgi:hypothetical protein